MLTLRGFVFGESSLIGIIFNKNIRNIPLKSKSKIDMCQERNNFIFCTCAEKEETLSNSDFLENHTWTLTSLLGLERISVRGKILLPKEDLGNGLTIQNILDQLNSNVESFDFEYKPNEKDCLKISAPKMNGGTIYFKVLFKNKNWIEGNNHRFATKPKIIATGKILKTNELND